MNAGFFNQIWHIGGSLPLPPGQSREDAFQRLAPLFRQRGTTYAQAQNTLTFDKKDQDAQDKMSVFDRGILRVEQNDAGLILKYSLVSRALLFCFLAPLLFLVFAQMNVAVGYYEKSSADTKEKVAHDKKVTPPQAMNPVDKFLGAPAPEKPKKDSDKKAGDTKYSPTSAYVFASIFAVLYIVGRILESHLIKRQFRRHLYEDYAANP